MVEQPKDAKIVGPTYSHSKYPPPPSGYVCDNCEIAGHWKQQCPKYRRHKPVKAAKPSIWKN